MNTVAFLGDPVMTADTRTNRHLGSLVAGGLTLAIAGATLLAPTAAHAATPSGSASPLRIVVTGEGSGVSHTLIPGGAPQVMTLDVSNDSAQPAQFTPELSGHATGALPLLSDDVVFTVSPDSAGGPAATGELDSQDGRLLGQIYPAGKPGTAFTVPAHTNYSWLLSLGATKSWPANDDGLTLSIGAPNTTPAQATVSYPVGTAKTGGPMVETLNGGSTLAPGQPMTTTLTVTNRTGAPLAQSWPNQIEFDQPVNSSVLLATDLWNGSAWQALPGDTLPTLPVGFADGASASYRIRVRVVSYTASASAEQVPMYVWGGGGPGTSFNLTKQLTVLRTAPAGGGTPGSTPTATARPTAATSATAASSVSAPAPASVAPVSGASADASPEAGGLAETGGGIDSGMLTGLALILLSVGAAITVALRRRARLH